MIELGPYTFCTVEEFLSEENAHKKDVLYAVFSAEIKPLEIMLPAQSRRREDDRRIRTKLEGMSFQQIPCFAYSKHKNKAQVFYLPSIPFKNRRDYGVGFLPGSIVLSALNRAFESGEKSRLFAIYLKDKHGSVSFSFIHKGQDVFTRIITPSNMEDFEIEFAETQRHLQREFQGVPYEVVAVGFPDAEIFNLPPQTPCHTLNSLSKGVHLDSTGFFYEPKRYPVKTAFAAAVLATTLAATAFLGTHGVQYAMTKMESAQLLAQKSEIEISVNEKESLKKAYQKHKPGTRWGDFVSTIDLLKQALEPYPFTITSINIRGENIDIRGKFWSFKEQYVQDNVEEAGRKLRPFLKMFPSGKVEKKRDWVSQAVQIGGKIFDDPQKRDFQDKVLGEFPRGMAPDRRPIRSESDNALYGQSLREKTLSALDAKHDIDYRYIYPLGPIAEIGKALLTSAYHFATGVAYAAPGQDADGMGYQNGSIPNPTPKYNQGQAQMGGADPFDHQGSQGPAFQHDEPYPFDRPDTHQREHPDDGAVPGRPDQAKPLIISDPEQDSSISFKALKITLDRAEEENKKLQKELEKIKKQREKAQKNMTHYNPPGFYLVSMTPECVVMSDDDGNSFFVEKGAAFFYEKTLFHLVEIEMGEKAVFVSDADALDLEEKLIFLQRSGNKTRGFSNIARMAAQTEEENLMREPVLSKNKPKPSSSQTPDQNSVDPQKFGNPPTPGMLDGVRPDNLSVSRK
ncbi:hypothetical protein [Geoalkalibacter subterraneus]|uniref:Uncharacterized protein n=1 Tax=Geoalkalibacter subterraneus TaxID=483547 RepID=A0A0B5FIT9_9BACT|nr:hypothetical protein [Geoalkalibacter subterraneus]AJF08112.1 hypothetical protein GSUB_16505 [Geoalkalibacter subterraneus]